MDVEQAQFILSDVVDSVAGWPDEEFVRKLLEEFQGTEEELQEYARANLKKWYCCIDQEPRWIQPPTWLYQEGRPMVFVGQVEITGKAGIGWFHDDTTFYLFMDAKTGFTDTVKQQY